MLAQDLRRLAAPFAPDDVEWKPGATTRDKTKGLAMCYISSRAVQNRLDDICGPADWRNEFSAGPEGGVLCGISVYVEREGPDGTRRGEWVTKWDGSESTDIEAVKGGLSGAMKRAAVQWGIGRYLYDLPAQWVRLDDRGRFAETPRIPREHLPAASAPAPRPDERRAPQTPQRPNAQQGERRTAPQQRSQSSAGPSSQRPTSGRRDASDQSSASPPGPSARRPGVQGQARRDASRGTAGGDGARREPDPRF